MTADKNTLDKMTSCQAMTSNLKSRCWFLTASQEIKMLKKFEELSKKRKQLSIDVITSTPLDRNNCGGGIRK